MIRQLKDDRCWELQPPTDEERWPHFDTEAAALEALQDDRENDGGDNPYPDAKAVQLAAPCFVVQCDGECENILDVEDEGWIFHHDTRHAAEATAQAHDWRFAGDLVYCDEDAPDDSHAVPPTPAELEAAGQLVIPGVLS